MKRRTRCKSARDIDSSRSGLLLSGLGPSLIVTKMSDFTLYAGVVPVVSRTVGEKKGANQR